MILAEQKRLKEAREVVEPLRAMCLVFGDYETLTRIGRAFKNDGDAAWERPPYGPLPDESARQYYREAFEMSGNYFPGVNATTLARLVGREDEAVECAERVLAICAQRRIGDKEHEPYWVFASEGEAMLCTSRGDRAELAAKFFDSALRCLTYDQAGMAQCTWNQLCRLWQALGTDLVGPSAEAFEQHPTIWNQLQPGPLGNCGRAGN